MAQTNTVIAMLEERFPNLHFVVGQEDTVGDQVLDRHLSDLGTTTASGLFTKSLEEALLAKTASFAVHSLKDMPTTLPDGLVLAAITKRESPEDAAVIHPKHKEKGIKTLKELPEGSVIGTSSLRREALLRSQFPTFEIKVLRGNIQTRLAKLDEHDDYDAIIVAACGFRRGELGDRIDEILPMDTFGYGTIEMLKTITDEKSAQLCKAERSLLYHLEGGCQIAMGVSATLDGDTLTLNSTVLSRDGKESVYETISGPRTTCEELGKQLAERFWDNELARKVLGKTRQKRALTYGDAEAPGDAAAAAAAATGSPTKKAKTSDLQIATENMSADQLTRAQNSRVLQAFRAIGVVADDVPVVWYGMGKASFATASLGKSFVVYNCDKLTPVLVSPQLPKRIAALAVQPKKHLTFTACGRQIIVWKRVQRIKTLLGHKGTIKQMMTILVGSEQGALQLWNVRKMKCIYEFKGWGSAVTALEQSPAVDVDQQSGITALSFRTDAGASTTPLVVSGSRSGDIAVWNLQTKRLESVIAGAHDGAVVSLQFLANEPLLLSSGTDNSIKMWIFDHLNGVQLATQVSSQEGSQLECARGGPEVAAHYAVCCDGDSCPRLGERGHVPRERDCSYVWRFEHRAIGKKVLRQFDPSNRVPSGSVEDLRRKKTQATSVAISSCGNYALVGSLGGSVFRYNMQSGEKRGSYPLAATPKAKIIRSLVLPGSDLSALQADEADKTAADAHNGPVSAVAVDALNEALVSAGIDGKLKFWGFKKHELRYEIDVGSPISQMELHRDSNLLCVACDDQVLRLSDARWLFSSSADASLRVWDIPTGKCVDWMRFQKPVTGLAVSPTGEFLATTHVSHVGIFLWANRSFFTEVFLDSEPTAPILMDMPVSLNEVDNRDQLGIGTERNPQLSVSSVKDQQVESVKVEDISVQPRAIKKRNKPIEPPKAPEQAPFFLQTARKDDVHPTFVPVVPEAKKETEKKDEEDAAMDGWGVGDGDEAWGDDEGEEPEEDEVAAPSSRIVKTEGMVTTRCKLATLLAKAVQEEEDEDYTVSRFNEVATYIQSLSASAVDVEMSTLCMGAFDEEGKKLLGWFLDFLREEMQTRRDFQVLQAYLNRFLKLHEELLVADSALLAQVDELGAVQQQQWQHLQKLLHNNLCLVQYLSKIQILWFDMVNCCQQYFFRSLRDFPGRSVLEVVGQHDTVFGRVYYLEALY
ncbi:Porphobilinogen deaminase, dipyrromethane cofactor binding site [Phytophthora cactorum]|nr:Porphobilinogen deaminase, dipyrromethane cofactor binding site [Phytophthora cactorum]